MFYRRKILLALLEAFGGSLSKNDCQNLLFLFCKYREKNYYDFFPSIAGNFSIILAQDKDRLTNLAYLTPQDDFQLKNSDQSYGDLLEKKDRAVLYSAVEDIGNIREKELLRKMHLDSLYNETAKQIVSSDDFRPESYRPKRGLDEPIKIGEKIGTENSWARRKEYALKEVFTSINDLVALAKGSERKSLATFKPREILDVVVENDEREWKKEWSVQLRQYNLFDLDEQGQGKERKILPKIPYKFSYKFLSDGDTNPRKLLIEDWELGALYWNCLRASGGDENEAKRQVKKKFFDEFCLKKDLYLFLGTTKQYQLVSPDPFIVIGVFYPPLPKEKIN